jgi:hypothetical protein
MRIENPIHSGVFGYWQWAIRAGTRCLLAGAVVATFSAMAPSTGFALTVISVTSDVPVFDTSAGGSTNPAVTVDGRG